MTRETNMTQQDKDFIKLREAIFKVIKDRRQWRRFKSYMEDYYPTK